MDLKARIILPLLVFSVMVTGGCAQKNSAINCPFTKLSWESSAEEMISLEGEGYDTYDSIYKGTTYTYPRDHLGKTGMIKYMYDDSGKLCNVSWSYTGKDSDDVMEVYRSVVEEMKDLHGDSRNDDGVGNYCEMWTSDGGTVMANAVVTNDTFVMQIAYMSPEVSKQGQ